MMRKFVIQELIIFLKIPLDVIPYFVFRLVNPEVTFAEDVGLQGQQGVHGFFPGLDVGLKSPVKRAVNILAE
jgi:hypothetical protein